MKSTRAFTTLFLGCLAMGAATSLCQAATIPFTGTSGGDPVSGVADFTIDAGADTLTVKLTNTTTSTASAGQLFTGIDFNLSGLTPSLVSDMAIERTVDNAGAFVDGGGPVDISWSLVALGGDSYQLNFNPNAKHAIIGPPDGGNYASSNGSIKGNPGHNPFAAEMATFVLSVDDLEDDTPIEVEVFRYGTALLPAVPDPNTNGGIPEPSTVVLLGLGLVGILGYRGKSPAA